MSYVQHGYELIHNNIQLLLIRTLPVPPNQASPHSPTPAPEPSTLQPLDPSGGYILQASVRLEGTKPELLSKGTNELLALRETLKGVVDLEAGDRLALDTRAKG